MKTEDIIKILRGRHPMFQGQWACLVEFQRVDFLAVGTWPSTKFVVHGYEIKTSRADWLRELKDPQKSMEGRAKVDHWWLAAPAGTLQPGELPEDWGYLEVSETGFKVVHQAPLLRPALPKKFTAGGMNQEWAARAAFAGMARRVAYAEADREALLALGDVMDLEPALTGAAIKTGRATPFQKEIKKARAKRSNGSAKRKKRRGNIPRQEYVGW